MIFQKPFDNLHANLQEQPAMDKHRIVGGGLLYKVLQGAVHHSDVQLLTLLRIILTERVLLLSPFNLKKGPI